MLLMSGALAQDTQSKFFAESFDDSSSSRDIMVSKGLIATIAKAATAFSLEYL
jgi:hypothetical protein